jgi:hypothetical protein
MYDSERWFRSSGFQGSGVEEPRFAPSTLLSGIRAHVNVGRLVVAFPMTKLLLVCAIAALLIPRRALQQASTGDCVTIAAPQPAKVFSYEHSESSGRTTTTTQQWESVTPTGSREKITGPAGTQIQVNTHRIVDDVAVLDRSEKLNANGGLIDATSFNPGLVSDPTFRACAGRTWTIGAVTATYRAASGQGGTAQTPSGVLKILALHEKITVPAGTFDTVHFQRATTQATDDYWKSAEHRVIVKHTGSTRGGSVSEVLVAVK